MQENKDRRHIDGTKEIKKSGVTCQYKVENGGFQEKPSWWK